MQPLIFNIHCWVAQVVALIQAVHYFSHKLQHLQKIKLKVWLQFVLLESQGTCRSVSLYLLIIRQDLLLVLISYLRLKPDLWLKDSGNLSFCFQSLTIFAHLWRALLCFIVVVVVFFFLEQGFSESLTSHKTTLELSEHTRFGRDLNGDLSLSPSFFAVIGFFLNFKKNNAASKVFLRQSCRLPITIIFSILS